MEDRTQTQIDTSEARDRLNEYREDEFYRFPSKLRESWTHSESESYAPMSYMEFKADQPSSEGGAVVTALQLVKIDDLNVGVRKGTVNTVIPTIGGVPLDDDYTLNSISINANTTLWLDATLNSSSVITAVAIVTTEPSDDTATQAKQVLGSVSWDGNKIGIVNSNLGGSQNVDSCGASHSWNRI